MTAGWEWPDSLDAVVAAPNSHRVLFENDEVRVLEVTVAPGIREPEHTHRWRSVMVTDQRARINYFTGPELLSASRTFRTGELDVRPWSPGVGGSVERPTRSYRNVRLAEIGRPPGGG